MSDVTNPQEEYSVTLPCAPDTFTEFIAKLLGKPQSIEQYVRGPFEVTKGDIENTFHLVDQRVQQNNGRLIQFLVRIVYDDGSSVTNNNLGDFQRYTEVRPLVSTGVHLSWVYLVKFPDRAAPEKQEIELSFDARSQVIDEIPGRPVPMTIHRRAGSMYFRVNHTNRTWGVDVESLLSNHLKGFVKEVPKFRGFLSQHAGRIGVLVGSVFLLLTLTGVFVSTNNFLNSQIVAARAVMGSNTLDLNSISQKLDFILQRAASGDWARFVFAALILLVGAIIASIFVGIWAALSAEYHKESFVLLSRKAEEHKTKTTQDEKRGLWMFLASIITSIFTGLISSVIFELAFSKWIQGLK